VSWRSCARLRRWSDLTPSSQRDSPNACGTIASVPQLSPLVRSVYTPSPFGTPGSRPSAGSGDKRSSMGWWTSSSRSCIASRCGQSNKWSMSWWAISRRCMASPPSASQWRQPPWNNRRGSCGRCSLRSSASTRDQTSSKNIGHMAPRLGVMSLPFDEPRTVGMIGVCSRRCSMPSIAEPTRRHIVPSSTRWPSSRPTETAAHSTFPLMARSRVQASCPRIGANS
jgi:hypothetical protein